MKSIYFALTFLFSIAVHAESWVCVPDDSVGFRFNKTSRSWERTSFNYDIKYLVRRPTEKDVKWGRAHEWVVVQLGHKIGLSECEDFNSVNILYCTGTPDFRFDRSQLKFVAYLPMPYFATNPGDMRDIGMHIGSCTKRD